MALVCVDTGRVEPGLRVDGLVNVAVLHAHRVELEMQVSAEGTARLSHVSDDLARLYRLAEPTAIEDMWDDMVVIPSACLRATWLPAQSPELPA